MANRKRPLRPAAAKDTCFAVTVFDPNGEPAFELMLYGLSESDVYSVPNFYVSEALNRRNLPLGYAVSIFAVERIR